MEIFYLRLRHRIQVTEEIMSIAQIAQMIASETIVEDIKQIPIHQVTH